MPFSAVLSVGEPLSQGLPRLCGEIHQKLGASPDLVVTFFSPHHVGACRDILAGIRESLAPRCLMGCVGEGIITNEREVENQPALCLWAARWNRPTEITPFHLHLAKTSEGPSLLGWPDVLLGAVSPGGTEPFSPTQAALLILGDPFTFPTDQFLARVNEDHPGLPVLGGMASGISRPGQCKLLLDDQVHDEGAVALLLHGELGLRWVVSQGCRPIGKHMVITKAEENVILELGGRPPFDILRELWPTLTAREQVLFQRGLHLGRVLNEYQGEFQRGDFLIRNVMGIEKQTGALIITDHVRVGQTVQFQVRDADSADEDLHGLLQLDLNAHESKPGGGLLFSCNGRGTRLFSQPDHDARVIQQEMGPLALAGFFAMGEIGPVGKSNFIHGFTASLALFED